jgi:hypothetical protein
VGRVKLSLEIDDQVDETIGFDPSALEVVLELLGGIHGPQ